ncbi:hypothetical protein H6F95_15625 [Cyanobacteria bacterium FACHB-471]|nr:hypothetical protein [Cyanobacteria bacterium FACHB-471]
MIKRSMGKEHQLVPIKKLLYVNGRSILVRDRLRSILIESRFPIEFFLLDTI